ncbi:MAG TPA: amidohydrolase [Solirubrobacteraceae bacterium]|nr:amidohydrolase [Solirubrobacteraceae bacterium]
MGNLAAPSFTPGDGPSFTDGGAGGLASGRDAGRMHPIILRGGPILTQDERLPVAEALAIRGDRVLAVGSATDVKRHFTPGTEIVDLDGRTILPGFVEPHLHVLMSALAAHWWLDVTPLVLPSKERVLAAVRDAAAQGGRGGWVVGFGYDPSRLPPDYPELDADELDAVAGGVPTLLVNQSGHVAYANRAALAAAGIGPDTPDPPAASFGRDSAGRLTGIVYEGPAIQAFLGAMPQPTSAQVAAMTAQTLRELAARGCTTIYDAGIGLVAGAAEHELLRDLAHAPDAPLRIRGAFTPELAQTLGAVPGEGDDRYSVVGIKFWADGSTQGFTAALEQPYLDGRGRGRLNHDDERLREQMLRWHRAGWQILVHSNGDRAIEQVLGCFESILGQEPPSRVRHRIEHFTLAQDEQAQRAAALGLAVSHTINHIYYWGESLRDYVLGAGRAAQIHSLARDFEHGICASCHSDSPVSPVDPMLALRTATTRLMRDSDDVLGPFQQLDLTRALRTVTANPARQVLLEDRVGVLREGMLADLVVLDRDPRGVAPERLHELRVLETWLGGRRQRWA